MLRYLAMMVALIATSFYFFPFYFTFLPTVNTKMMMSFCGLVTFLMKLGMSRKGKMEKDFMVLSLWALVVSFVSFVSITVNNTPDSSYLYYIVSMWVWLGGAYFVVSLIKRIHGKVSVELVCFYLITVCVLQCILAEAIELIPAVKTFVDSFLAGEGFMGKNEGRLYGLGCALDVAGSRFAVVSVMIAYLLPRVANRENHSAYICSLLVAFLIIALIGNIIGRTTLIGLLFGIVYLVYAIAKVVEGKAKRILIVWMLGCTAIALTVAVVLYNTDAAWREQLRFGFEGFFSLVEEGHWEYHSNEQLAAQIVWPDNLHTWLIGDGYMASTDIDPYYTGITWHGFYKGTDAGYCRFIFYFGLVGMAAFSLFMIKAGAICMRRFKPYMLMFAIMLVINFIVWVKVSTDLFVVFAPFLALSAEDEEACDQELSEAGG